MNGTLVRPVARRWRVSAWAAGCLIAGAGSLTWWLSGIGLYHGPDHMIGPYRVPLALEYGAGAVAIAAGTIALVWSLVRPSSPRPGLSGAAEALLVVASIIATGSWRIMTAGGDGANIGGGGVALLGPFTVAALLFAAVTAERRSRDGIVPHFKLIAVLAWGSAPALFAVIWILSR